jgi:hypothetical protein
MIEFTDPTRPRGILNERERRYLLGESDIEPRSQAERDIRATIRSRLRHAIYDFALLFTHLEDRDIEQVFNPRSEDITALRTALEDTIGFFYRSTVNFHPPFHQLAQEGIQRAEQTHFNRYVKATIDVEPTAPVDLSEIREKMAQQQAQGLSPEEAMWIAETIIASGDFAFDDFDEAHEQLRKRRAGIEIESEDDPDTTTNHG